MGPENPYPFGTSKEEITRQEAVRVFAKADALIEEDRRRILSEEQDTFPKTGGAQKTPHVQHDSPPPETTPSVHNNMRRNLEQIPELEGVGIVISDTPEGLLKIYMSKGGTYSHFFVDMNKREIVNEDCSSIAGEIKPIDAATHKERLVVLQQYISPDGTQIELILPE